MCHCFLFCFSFFYALVLFADVEPWYIICCIQISADAPQLTEYNAYIDFELKQGDPARVQSVFERALIENCLVSDLWNRYAKFLVSSHVFGKQTYFWQLVMFLVNGQCFVLPFALPCFIILQLGEILIQLDVIFIYVILCLCIRNK